MTHPYHLHVIADQLNVITLAIMIFFVAILIFLGRHLWVLMTVEREKIRTELPRLIIGELMTRDEFVRLYERVYESETKLEYVENRLDAHLEQAQQTGNG